jgi:hypothetical protein
VVNFNFGRPLLDSEQVDLAFKIQELAIENRLGFQLGCNIVQPVVFEILGKKDRRLTGKEFVFFITESPISNISDAIVHPNLLDPIEIKETLGRNMRRVQRFFSSVAEIESLVGVSLYVSLGYDTSYNREDISLGELAERCVSKFNILRGAGIPSTDFIIRF